MGFLYIASHGEGDEREFIGAVDPVTQEWMPFLAETEDDLVTLREYARAFADQTGVRVLLRRFETAAEEMIEPSGGHDGGRDESEARPEAGEESATGADRQGDAGPGRDDAGGAGVGEAAPGEGVPSTVPVVCRMAPLDHLCGCGHTADHHMWATGFGPCLTDRYEHLGVERSCVFFDGCKLTIACVIAVVHEPGDLPAFMTGTADVLRHPCGHVARGERCPGEVEVPV